MSRTKCARLYVAAHFDEHWQGVIEPWFARACEHSWRSESPIAAVVPSRAHGYFLRSLLLRKGMSFAGIRFWTPPDVRAFFAAKFAPPRVPGTLENLHLLLSAAAELHAGQPAAAAVALEPGSFLRVINMIETAGWDFREIGLPALRDVARDFKHLAHESGLQTLHESDEWLLRAAQKNRAVIGSLLVSGFTASHWPLWTLLRATCHAAADATICLNQLRPTFTDIDSAWIGSWEQTFGTAEPLPGNISQGTFTDFSESFEAGVVADNRNQMSFRIGVNTAEQAQAIVAQTVLWLSDNDCDRLGILFPGYTALAREVAALLVSRGISHNDGIGHLRPGVFEGESWQAWLAFQDNPRISRLLRFVRACPAKLIDPLHAEDIEDVVRRVFDKTLVNDLAVIAAFLDREQCSERQRQVGAVLKSIELLPDNVSLAQFNETAARIFKHFDWKAEADQIARESAQLEKFSNPISRRAYLRWLSEITNSFQRVRDDHGDHPYAKVHLVSYDYAGGQRWSHLIFTSLNEGIWPPRPVETGYLSEREIESLNASIVTLNKRATRQGPQGEGHIVVEEGKAFCLGARERRGIAQRQFAELIESAETALCATASLTDESDPGRRLKPSGFFNRLCLAARGVALADSEMERLQKQTSDWIASSKIFPADEINEQQIAPMLHAFIQRRDATQPFGEFEFALKTPLSQPTTIQCSEWDRVVQAPAAIWMRNFAGIESPIYDEEAEPWVRVMGTWVHDWLARISPVRSMFTPFPAMRDFLDAVRNAANYTRAEVEDLVTSLGRNLPAWWFSLWSQAAYFAGKLARIASRIEGWPQVASEFRLNPPVQVSLGYNEELRVAGRIDLLLADGRNGQCNIADLAGRNLWVIDYKTGGSSVMSTTELEHGRGFQVALYALALRQLGAAQVEMSIVKPDSPAEPQLDLAALDQFGRVWKEIRRMQDSGIFGAIGEMRSEFGAGAIYPLATLLIDSDVLAAKWDRTHPGFVREEEDETFT